MKKIVFILLVILVAIFTSYSLQKKPKQEQKLKVAATIFPLYEIVKNIAQDKIEVVLIIKPGASPHTFEVSPEDIKKVSAAKILFSIGHGLDDWVSQIIQDAGVSKAVIVDKNIDLVKSDEKESNRNGSVNPHYWLSAKNAKEIANTVSQELVSIDPKNATFYSENTEKYQALLDNLDQELKEKLKLLRTRKIATFHGAWVYFAKDYNLEIVATFEPFPGKKPPPSYLAEFQKKIKKNNIKVIFSEPQLSVDVLKPVAEDLGVEILILDPLGGEGERESFIELLRFNVSQIEKALK